MSNFGSKTAPHSGQTSQDNSKLNSKILATIGLSKESIQRMLGISSKVQQPKRKPRQWKKLPEFIANQIRGEHSSITYRELADKYNISQSAARTAKLSKQQTTEIQWKELCHELAACLGCGCTKQSGLCVQCHKSNNQYQQLNKRNQ